MEVVQTFRWAFLPRFRRNAFGWRGSTLAVQRVRQAVAEICKVARKNPVLAGEGAVRLFERVSGALEQIDSSSGAIGSAVYVAIEELVPIIASAPVEAKVRNAWLDRLWKAHEEDQIPYQDVDVRMETVVYRPEDFRKGEPLALEIERTGIELRF